MENENKKIIVGEDGSYFDGGYFAYIGYNIAVAFVTSVTFGIAHPWMRCWYQKWLCEHTVINGKRMTFNGRGGDLFVKYIIWLLLSYVTCGIYALWMNVALKKWMSEHTHFEGEPDNNSFFDGGVGDYFITSILSALALWVPFAGPAWSKIIITRWFINHTVIDSRRLTFRGGVGDLFVKYLLWGILTTITCGIFAWFVPVKYIKWETEHTFDENGTPEALNMKANYKTQIHTDAVMLQSGDAEQIETVKAQMITEANEGIANNDLVKLEGALRFADILKECGNEFTESEEELIYNCIILARKLKAEKPVQTKSKLWLIIVAAIAAVIMFISVAGAAVVVMALFGMKMPAVRYPAAQQDGASVSSAIMYDSFYNSLEGVAAHNGYTLTEVASGVDERVFSMCDSIPNSYVEIYIETNGMFVEDIAVYGSRWRNDLNNEYNIRNAAKYVYKALGLGGEYDYSPDLSIDSTNYYGAWTFEIDAEDSDVSIEISK